MAEDVTALGINGFVKCLEVLNTQFAEEIHKSETREIRFHELEEARNRGNLFVRQIVAKTMGEHNQDSEEDNERRDAVLGPILEQVERSRQGRLGRRVDREIEPDSGEVIGEGIEVAVSVSPLGWVNPLAF